MCSSRGGVIIKALAVYHSNSCRGTHSNMVVTMPPTILRNPIRFLRVALGFMGLPGGYSKRDIKYLTETREFEKNETGYMRIQGTKPQVRNTERNSSSWP